MYKDYLEKQLEAVCWGLILVLFICIILTVFSFFQSFKITKYENGMTKGELIEFDNTRYKCDKVEIKEVVWKKIK